MMYSVAPPCLRRTGSHEGKNRHGDASNSEIIGSIPSGDHCLNIRQFNGVLASWGWTVMNSTPESLERGLHFAGRECSTTALVAWKASRGRWGLSHWPDRMFWESHQPSRFFLRFSANLTKITQVRDYIQLRQLYGHARVFFRQNTARDWLLEPHAPSGPSNSVFNFRPRERALWLDNNPGTHVSVQLWIE